MTPQGRQIPPPAQQSAGARRSRARLFRLAEVASLIAGVLFAAAAAGAAAQAPAPDRAASPGGGTDWPVFRGNQRLTGAVSTRLPDVLALRWSFKTGAEIRSSPVIAGGRVFVGSSDGKLYALRLSDGAKLWEFDAGDAIEAPPLFVDGRVVFGSLSGVLHAVDAESGRTLWTNAIQSRISGSANWIEAGEKDGQRIVFGGYDSTLRCVEASTGQPVWSFAAEGYINGAPAVDGDRVVFGGCDAQLRALSAQTGQELARVDAGAYIPGSPAVAGPHAFVGHYGNKLICADLLQKRIVWEYGDEVGGAPFFSSPAVGADRVVIGCRDQQVHAVRREDGTRAWTFLTRGDVDSPPVICADRVVAASSDGRVYVLKLSDGALVWSYEVGAPITGAVAVTEAGIVLGAEDGCVYAFGAAP